MTGCSGHNLPLTRHVGLCRTLQLVVVCSWHTSSSLACEVCSSHVQTCGVSRSTLESPCLASAASSPFKMQLSPTASSNSVCHSTPRCRHSHHTAAACPPQKAPATSSCVCRAAQTSHEQQHHDTIIQKRSLLLGVAGFVAASWLQQLAPANAAASKAAAAPLWDLAAAADLVPAVLELERSPDQSKYDPAVSDLQPFLSGEHGRGGGVSIGVCWSLRLRWHHHYCRSLL
jgi:hypothetical protein